MRFALVSIANLLPSPLWGGAGEGVARSCRAFDFGAQQISQDCATPHPTGEIGEADFCRPPPQGGREQTPLRILVALILVALATPAAAFPSQFDGDWQVEARTTVGECTPEASGTVRIEGGRVVGSSVEGVEAWGYLEDNGDISARFTAGQKMARANGKLKGASGSGAWSSNTDYCGGVWKAQKTK